MPSLARGEGGSPTPSAGAGGVWDSQHGPPSLGRVTSAPPRQPSQAPGGLSLTVGLGRSWRLPSCSLGQNSDPRCPH